MITSPNLEIKMRMMMVSARLNLVQDDEDKSAAYSSAKALELDDDDACVDPDSTLFQCLSRGLSLSGKRISGIVSWNGWTKIWKSVTSVFSTGKIIKEYDLSSAKSRLSEAEKEKVC